MASNMDRDPTPKPMLKSSEPREYRSDVLPIKPTVTTVCSGPRSIPQPSHPNSRRDREERIKARKMRDKPPGSRAIDTLVNATPRGTRQRLKKARPQISTPDLHPAPLNTRSSSTASSNASWKKITEFTRTPVSAVPSETTPISATGYTPISPTASNGSDTKEVKMTLSPVMLVAEEVPVPKTKPQHKPARLVVKEGKSYMPRPRSASLLRNALKGRSINRSRPSTRANSPAPEPQDDEAPPMPSPPPNCKLPPTPPASGSEKRKKVKAVDQPEGDKSIPPTTMPSLGPPNPVKASGGAEQPSTSNKQPQRTSGSSKDTRKSPDVSARLAYLEHRNNLLHAALMAVLETNGQHNMPLADSVALDALRAPAAWETRIARRKASDAASSSNGDALEMYMSTRRGSKYGF